VKEGGFLMLPGMTGRVKRRGKAMGLGIVLAGVAVVGPLSLPASATSAPSCVSFWTSGPSYDQTYHAYNGCGNYQRVRFNVAYHVDSGCYNLPPGWEARYTVYNPASYLQGVSTC
jgi:hypothetical protein